MKSPAKPVALITGGTRGIGLGCALALADSGFNLMLCGRRPPDQVAPALQELTARGIAVRYRICDVAEAAQRTSLLDALRDEFGQLHVLVNNAGIAPAQRCDLLEATEASFERLLRINLQGPYFLTQAAARWMVEQRQEDAAFHGCIVNISSVSATLASVNRGEYCISKAGIAMATQLWAARLASQGISVFEVRPGVIATDMTAGVRELYDARIADGLVPENRWGTPADVGAAVAMLARGDLPYATGTVLNVDGGLSIPRL